jgi:hypothetical protein
VSREERSEGLGVLEAANIANMTKDRGYRRHSQAGDAGNELRVIFEIRMPIDVIVDILFQLFDFDVEPHDVRLHVRRNVFHSTNCVSFQPILFLLPDAFQCLNA